MWRPSLPQASGGSGRQAGLSSKWTVPDGHKAHRMGFHQPTRAHDQWHTDFAYVNLRGTHYFFTSVLDGYSRYIVHWDLRASMTTDDVELVIQRALESLPKGVKKPRLISDNGPQYISTEFRSYLRDQEVVHSRIRGGTSPKPRQDRAVPEEPEVRMHPGLPSGKSRGGPGDYQRLCSGV